MKGEERNWKIRAKGEEKGGREGNPHSLPTPVSAQTLAVKASVETGVVGPNESLLICVRMSVSTQNLHFRICPTTSRRKRNAASAASVKGGGDVHVMKSVRANLQTLILIDLYCFYISSWG